MNESHPLRHPLVVLFIGTVLGSIIVPFGAAKFSEQRADRDSRRNLVTRVLQYDTDTRQALLSLHTRLYVSHENLIHFNPDEAERRARQVKLMDEATEQYLAFDNEVWTTPKQILNELRVRQLVSASKLTAIERDISEYHGLVWNARNAIHVFWMACVDKGYRPEDPHLEELHAEADLKRKKLDTDGAVLMAKAAAKIRGKERQALLPLLHFSKRSLE